MKKISLILSVLLIFSGCNSTNDASLVTQTADQTSTITYTIEKEFIHPEDPSLPVKIAIIGEEYLNKESLNILGQELKQQYQKNKNNIMIVFLVDKKSVNLVEKMLNQTLSEEESASLMENLAATYSSYKEGDLRKKMYQINEIALEKKEMANEEIKYKIIYEKKTTKYAYIDLTKYSFDDKFAIKLGEKLKNDHIKETEVTINLFASKEALKLQTDAEKANLNYSDLPSEDLDAIIKNNIGFYKKGKEINQLFINFANNTNDKSFTTKTIDYPVTE